MIAAFGKARKTVFILCFVAALCFIVASLVLLLVRERVVVWEYGVMIDAGSSGSRVMVFAWPHANDNDEPLVQQLPANAAKPFHLSPGLASLFLTNSTDFYDHLQQLVARAKSLVPSSSRSKSPLYLFGTAGMRALEPSEQQKLLTALRKFFHEESLSSTGFLYDKSKSVRIISGQEESSFGWLTVNYLSNKLDEGYHFKDRVPFGSRMSVLSGDVPSVLSLSSGTNSRYAKTFGAIDMGGKSLEISYFPRMYSSIPQEYLHAPIVDDVAYEIYSTSFMNLGRDAAQTARLRELAKKETSNVAHGISLVVGSDVCLPKGYSVNVSVETNVTVTLNGAGDYSSCYSDLISYLNVSVCNYLPRNCSIGGAFMSQPSAPTFFGLSMFSTMVDVFNMSDNSTISDFKSEGLKICSLSYADALKRFQNYTPSIEKYVYQFCFDFAYSVAILHDGFRIPMTGDRFIFRNEIDNVEVSWTLGAILVELNLFPIGVRSTRSVLFHHVWLVSVLVLVIAGIFGSATCAALLWQSGRVGKIRKKKGTAEVDGDGDGDGDIEGQKQLLCDDEEEGPDDDDTLHGVEELEHGADTLGDVDVNDVEANRKLETLPEEEA